VGSEIAKGMKASSGLTEGSSIQHFWSVANAWTLTRIAINTQSPKHQNHTATKTLASRLKRFVKRILNRNTGNITSFISHNANRHFLLEVKSGRDYVTHSGCANQRTRAFKSTSRLHPSQHLLLRCSSRPQDCVMLLTVAAGCHTAHWACGRLPWQIRTTHSLSCQHHRGCPKQDGTWVVLSLLL
jgi:hypothetical protein